MEGVGPLARHERDERFRRGTNRPAATPPAACARGLGPRRTGTAGCAGNARRDRRACRAGRRVPAPAPGRPRACGCRRRLRALAVHRFPVAPAPRGGLTHAGSAPVETLPQVLTGLSLTALLEELAAPREVPGAGSALAAALATAAAVVQMAARLSPASWADAAGVAAQAEALRERAGQLGGEGAEA